SMPTAATLRRRDRTAIAGSIAVHLCVLVLAAATVREAFPVSDPDERFDVRALIRIEHRAPAPLAKPHRVVRVERPAPVATAPPIHAARAVEHAARPQVVAPERRAALAPARRDEERRTAIPVRIAVDAQPSPVVAPAAAVAVTTAAATPASPAPTATPSAPPAERDEGIGNFGETYPASIDPQLRSAFFTGLAGTFDIRITVDDRGRALDVTFVRGPSDPA